MRAARGAIRDARLARDDSMSLFFEVTTNRQTPTLIMLATKIGRNCRAFDSLALATLALRASRLCRWRPRRSAL